ncbi:hypothetical protein BBJ29_003121 [Phytophthora kernoviae]|uniref:SURP motif domain-containing protein n=1 Tax=Phytophthora kernoviae TaxID=325452 RepID=A0A3F2RV83_9STRA|nr:hypothetical protein BBJ29_003121 [Phytophthora kernoviae]RLN63872.1 hypothetical protein BBP00_00003809 [Phytophthora kernoviae]
MSIGVMASEGEDGGSTGSNLLALGVRGYACQVFDDPQVAWTLHQETHLIPWREESGGDLRIDRFDARNLLENRSQFRQLKKRKRQATISNGESHTEATADTKEGQTETEQQLLHRLRFGDYAMEFPPTEEPEENKFPYLYPEDESDNESDGEAFEPQWTVPDHLTIPKTKKRHAILEATANKVRGNSQLEVMLKVKLSANTKFRFLDASHALHGYYCFLRDENPQSLPKKAGVSLLGEEYIDVSARCVLLCVLAVGF